MKYETVIGLEVHAQLKTRSKIFCSCSTEFGKEPNENTCPVCLGMPGVLPVLNRKVVEYAMKACLATHCEIQPVNQFARKNYFYPDLPKGYQVSQFDLPIGLRGHLTIQTPDGPKRIGLTRIHMEEDAGKSIHGENLGDPDKSYVDYNRTGVPLIEIVSEPELRSAEDAREYLVALKSVLQYADVSDCNMEEGSFRCDANVSLRPVGQQEFGTRVELKNINSFKFVQKAIEYEVERQTKILDQGDQVVQETRLYDANRGITFSMRSKEEAHDYRYFPEPDLVPVACDEDWIESIRHELPEMPEEKRRRFVEQYGLPEYDAGVLTTSRALADYFEACVALFNQPKLVSNWIMGELLRLLNQDDRDIGDCPVTPEKLATMLKLIDAGTISGKIAKAVFEEMYRTGKEPAAIIEEKGLTQISDEGALGQIVDDIIANSPEQVQQFKDGRDKVLGYFIGQAMKASKGQANPGLLNKLFKEKLGQA
ncbi:Aspartyl/glutamyl-tRNA(Asn/Gln) amidotransferase, subunit B [Nitrospina gracilis 3/211]|uniref:Aspartyl/glutamyl-tRNA(Asn/Gln) amidotransferase subunit B n=1 Tax=Nitrospina gracilis (strain 3/211) TaxID=1266370 RepID=M1Z313_NITG3|nr:MULTISPECIES: Asp-tRNA(Asn)/Glu-tRNA(Gln) amidotransferase subunit GatB [Nitrospina]MCF8721999.1 aspartyl-tRNA(Asn)/glutamyl-tRNA(Gln) amidotransferase subunit B [Nitrospina sp. Nb-3]CCQ92125.1 Aspartyl/glutamyl-tRNA(Asn/Gln) amidotransferase, subunit B [Nitrospina gracilis 3/211]